MVLDKEEHRTLLRELLSQPSLMVPITITGIVEEVRAAINEASLSAPAEPAKESGGAAS